ncbi:Proteophosphoglycan ppg4 [Favolaschia claudopus]|uniref:Proteophosphoglycan ppg4 n=1 Tax=Favolaschia claudopus TaxID=2862362 RepID=A0AAW0CTD5_9AGAR
MLLPNSRPESRALGSDSQGGPNFSSSTWIPIAVVVSVLTLLAILACTRKSIRSRVAAMGSGVAIASGMPPRELTAEQLAGSINRAPAAPPRRTRRPRRTPSQISTVSLPAYMKEPGEQELVVSRGPDGEDVAMPAALAVEEDDDQSHEDHQSSEEGNANPNPPDNSRYSPMPHSPHDTPLLGGDDPRGEAPAYFEVLEPGEANYPPGISVAPPEPESPMPQRRSGFFSMFRSAPPALPLPAASPANDTVPSAAPVDSTSRLSLTHTRTRSTTNTPNTTRHRASTSTSTLFSLGRKKSSASLAHGNLNNLTSPSLISLASISHPLPHTLVKTEFSALPKNGFTPEQLSLISGTKEGGVSRFGVPWGDAAVAYAHASASTSRIVLDEGDAPPPGWDEISGLPVPSSSGLSSSSEQAVASGSGSSSSAEASGSGFGATARLSTSSAASPSAAETLTPATALSRADSVSRPPATPAESLAPTSLSRADSHASYASRASRASGVSTQTFATAREGGSDTEEEDEEDVSELRLPMHTLEASDATVRP